MRKYFEEHNPNVETLASQSSLAEWIVDLTTQVRFPTLVGSVQGCFFTQ